MSGYMPIHEDPSVPDEAILIAEVTVSQYVLPDGKLGLRTHRAGDVPLSSILGLLALGAIDIYNWSDRGEGTAR